MSVKKSITDRCPCIEQNPTSQSVFFGGQFLNLTILSGDSHLSISYMSKIFNLKRTPSLRSSKRIAAALHIDVGDFIALLDEYPGTGSFKAP